MVLVRRGQGKEILLMDPSLFKFHKYLFIFSHARSYSTLLCHILGSHPRIAGYSESMLAYDTAVELIRLNAAAVDAGNYRHDCEYVLDKILYDHLTVSDEVLGNPRVVPIFLVRAPGPSIASLVRMRVREHEQKILNWFEGTDLETMVREAAVYYAERLEALRGLCDRARALGRQGLFLSSEGFLEDTGAAFRFLERELELDEPLREDYTLFEHTGQSGFGDTSATIRTGRILRPTLESDQVPSSDGFTIPADLLDRARAAHAECTAHLRASPMLKHFGETRPPIIEEGRETVDAGAAA